MSKNEAWRRVRAQVVAPDVKENATAREILDQLAPQLACIGGKVISAWLAPDDLIWKINYHWEYLRELFEHCRGLALESETAQVLTALHDALGAQPPKPAAGYLAGPIGQPVDRSPEDAFARRYEIVCEVKRQLDALRRRTSFEAKSPRPRRAFDYAVARVASPACSKHGAGTAFDIEGDVEAIRALCERLGATRVFDEGSHVHVEFERGVRPAERGSA